MFIDGFSRNRATGGFIVIDAVSLDTVAAGMVSGAHPFAPGSRSGRGEAPASRDITEIAGVVDQSRRTRLLGQKPATLWLTGLSGAGKSTLAYALEDQLIERGRACCVLDGDNIRHGLSRDLGFAPDERRENIRRVAEVAALMNDAGLIVITAFISPYRDDRAMARGIVGGARFIEVYLDASLEDCERRDPRGLYRRARRGEIPGFTGIGSPYEKPESADLVLNTVQMGVADTLPLLLERILHATRP